MIACNLVILQFILLFPKSNNVTVHGSRPPPEVPGNQGSILCNDQGGQNNVINDSTTQFPTSFPETMVSTNAYSILLQCPLN